MTLNQSILNHTQQCGEEECCGFVIDSKVYLECKNVAKDKQNNFEISLDDFIEAQSIGQITAVVHSHPKGLPILSEADQFYQQKTALDWWLVCDNQIYKYRCVKPLLGREFEYGISDCYTLFRDAYHLCGFNFPDFNRDDDWWREQNLYLDNMASNGFYPVNEVQRGDVILIHLGAKVPNHAAIYIGEQHVLHHCPKRLSKRDLYDGYWLKHTHSIWRHTLWQSSSFTAILSNMAISSR